MPNAVVARTGVDPDVANGPSYMLNRTSFEQAMGRLGVWTRRASSPMTIAAASWRHVCGGS